MAARHEEGCYQVLQKKLSIYFLVCIELSNDDVGESRDTIFRWIRPGAGFKTDDFLKEKLGGAAVVRLSKKQGKPSQKRGYL